MKLPHAVSVDVFSVALNCDQPSRVSLDTVTRGSVQYSRLIISTRRWSSMYCRFLNGKKVQNESAVTRT